MPRPTAQADSLILTLSDEYSNKGYLNMAKRGRGIGYKEVFNVNDILLGDLRQNTYTETLTPFDRDLVIDYLIANK